MTRVKYPSVSVVVCCYNGADVLPNTLKALSRQNWKGKLEIIVVDDGSSDDTSKVAKSFNVRLIRNKQNLGLAASRNVGARAAKGEFIIYTDDDCRPQPSWVSRLCAEYQDDSTLAVGGKVTSKESDSYVRRYLRHANPLRPLENTLSKSSNLFYRLGLYLKSVVATPSNTAKDRKRSVYSLVGANMSFRKRALESVGYFDERFRFGGEEEDIFRRINLQSQDGVIYSPHPEVIHHFEPDIKDTLRRSKAYGKGNARMFYKYPGSYPVIYPIPFAILLSLALGLIHPFFLLSPLLLIPFAYTRWVIKGLNERSVEIASYSYLQFAQECASNVGLFKGLFEFKRTFRTPIINPKPSKKSHNLLRSFSASKYLTPPILWSGALLVVTLLAHVQNNQALSLVSSIGIIAVPGVLLAMLLRVTVLKISHLIAIGIPLGTVWVMALGVFSVIFLPVFGVERPLDSVPMLVLYFISLALLNLAVYVRGVTVSPTQVQKPAAISIGLYVLASIAPLLSAFGAILLNSNGSSVPAVMSFIASGVVMILATFFGKRTSSSVFPYVLFMASLGALWSYSLRSGSMFGWDIQQEYDVFITTLQAGVWHIGQAHSAYDAMLSITVLPSVITNVSGLLPVAVFKVFSPLLFSVLPVLLYYIYGKFTKRSLAFVGALLTIAQFAYMQQFSGLVRQQVAFLIFAALLYILVRNRPTEYGRGAIVALGFLAFGLAVSHYTTTYITIALVALPLLIVPLYRIIWSRSILDTAERKTYTTSILLVCWLGLVAFTWYVPLTQSGGILAKVSKGVNVGEIHQSLSKGTDTSYSSVDSAEEYLATVGSEHRQEHPYYQYYEDAENSSLGIASVPEIPERGLFYATTITLQIIINFGIWIAGLAGALWLYVKGYKSEKVTERIITQTIGMAGMIFIIAHVVPGVEGLYNISRLNQQLLILLALPAVLATVKLLRQINALRQTYVLAATASILFILSSGTINQVVGGVAAANLNNFGSDYQRFFIHDTEVTAATWLQQQRTPSETVYADRYASLRLTVPATIDHGLMNDVTPETLARGSYVYLSNSNITNRTVYGSGGGVYVFETPFDFLDSNKSKIYTNGGSEIYR